MDTEYDYKIETNTENTIDVRSSTDSLSPSSDNNVIKK